jgi:hypothetical protein
MTKRKATIVRVGAGVVLMVLAGLVLYTQLTALSYAGLKDQLRAQGATIQDEGVQPRVFPVRVLAGTGYLPRINGAQVAVFEYRTTLAASYDTTRISADGTSFRPSFVPFGGHAGSLDFFAPIHWFHRGKVIALYVGQQDDLLALLRHVLGPQFAGN